jgi:hypothetical protein
MLMTRVLLATAAALILSAASVTTADAQRGGHGGAMGGGFSHGFSGGGFSRGASPGGFSGGGFSRGASPGGFSGGGFARSAPAFRGGMASPGAQFRSGNFGNRSAVIGSNQFRGPGQFRGSVAGGNQFRAIGPGNRFAGRHFRHGRRFAFAIGAPYYYDDYGYGYYDDAYPYDDSSCYETRRVHTRNGWRYRQVYVCN